MLEGNKIHSKPELTDDKTKVDEKTKNETSQLDEDKPSEKMHKNELIEKVEQLHEESKRNYDLYLRSQAEMENLKKRHKKDREDWLKYANESLIREVLPILDNLERAIAHCENGSCLDSLRQGVELTLKSLKTALVKSGVEEIKTQGEPFDPCFHEAISAIPDEKVAPGTILEAFQKGYVLHKRLLRPAKVIVSKAMQPKTDNAADPTRICEEDI